MVMCAKEEPGEGSVRPGESPVGTLGGPGVVRYTRIQCQVTLPSGLVMVDNNLFQKQVETDRRSCSVAPAASWSPPELHTASQIPFRAL